MSGLSHAMQSSTLIRWNPSRDLIAILISYVVLVGMLYTANVIIGPQIWGGMAYFLLYGVPTTMLLGIGFPLYWTVVVRRQPISDLGLTTRNLGLSLGLQLVLGALQFFATLSQVSIPGLSHLLPLVALALAIGFFEAVFWRGWVLTRLEAAFGFLPALLVGSLLYAFYHIVYAMTLGEMIFIFFIGMLYALSFRLIKNIFILWPIFQPMGQLITLLKDGLDLPPLASLGFIEALIGMLALVWLANRYQQGKLHRSARA